MAQPNDSRNHRLFWALAVALIAPGAVTGQAAATDAQAIRLATLRLLTQQLEYMPQSYRGAPFRVLMQTPLPQAINGKDVVTPTGAPVERSEAELSAMAAQIGARLAVPGDKVTCTNPPGCSGTHGLLVTLGEPVIRGDSAAIMWLLQRSSADSTRSVHVPPEQRAIFLRRTNGVWRATSFGYGGQGPIREIYQVDSLGRPVKQ